MTATNGKQMNSGCRAAPMARYGLIAIVFICGMLAAESWIAPCLSNPRIALDDVLMFRPDGDIQHYPLIGALAHGIFGEHAVLDRLGLNFQSFPFPSILTHALGYLTFGPAGFLVADVVLLALHLALALLLFRMLKLPEPWPETCACLVTFYPVLENMVSAAAGMPVNLPMDFWNYRIPRPMGSAPFFLLSLVALVAFLHQPHRAKAGVWLLLGASLALLLQVDFYFAIPVGLCCAICVLVAIVTRPGSKAQALAGPALAGLAFLVAASPFIAQRALEIPDVTRRMGLYAVSRVHPFFLTGRKDAFLIAVDGAAWALGWFLCSRRGDDVTTDLRRRLLHAGFLLCLCGYFALPVTCVVTGIMTLPYHFPIAHHVISSYFLLATGISIVTTRLRGPWMNATHAGAALLVSLLALAYSRQSAGAAIRQWSDPSSAGPTFARITHELERDTYRDCRILGTFDFEIYSWWITFHRRFAFCPDAFASTMHDDEIEERLTRFCRLAGMSTSNFVWFVDNIDMNARWLSLDKYQASRAHTFAPIDAYDAASRARIAQTGILNWSDSWHLELPVSERTRLAARFDHAPSAGLVDPAYLRPDVVVVDHGDTPFALSPTSSEYVPTYSDGTYRVWILKSARAGKDNVVRGGIYR